MKLLATKEIFYYGKTLALHSKKDNSVYFLVDNYDELFGLESTFDAEKDLKYITECLQQIEVRNYYLHLRTIYWLVKWKVICI